MLGGLEKFTVGAWGNRRGGRGPVLGVGEEGDIMGAAMGREGGIPEGRPVRCKSVSHCASTFACSYTCTCTCTCICICTCGDPPPVKKAI